MSTEESQKKPWPTKDAMNQIYEKNLWGGNSNEFYSGDGSHDPLICKPYISVVQEFLNSFEERLTVCDLGCGDFNIGKNFLSLSKKYIAVDIVEGLILRNKETFKANGLEFKCLDVATDNLPTADIVILRQVLQHLSNTEVKSIVPKLKNFKYLILTEHLPVGEFEPNKDIISGQGIRIKKNSGVVLVKQPFSLNPIKTKELSVTILEKNKGVIKTILYQMF